jgi:predicted ATPase
LAAEGNDFFCTGYHSGRRKRSGKSTFLEALARKLRLPAIGSADAAQDASLDAVARCAIA